MPLPLLLLPGMAYAADIATRNDAIASLVVSERDYLSAWLTTLRNQWRMLGGKCEVTFGSLPHNDESLTGCDGMFIIEGPEFFKVLLLEAKTIKLDMDYTEIRRSSAGVEEYKGTTTTRTSHFSDQIARQAAWLRLHEQHAIIEMFFNFRVSDDPFAIGFDPYGSTCVSHRTARCHVSRYGGAGKIRPEVAWRWNVDVPYVCTRARASFPISSALESLLNCNIGDPMHAKGGGVDLHLDGIREWAANRGMGRDRAPVRQTSFPDDLGMAFLARFQGPWQVPKRR